MDTALSWVKAYVPDLDVTPSEYTDAMTLTGTKVEGYKELDKNLEKIVVGEILSIEKHPDADKLSVETIDDGSEGGRVILSGLAPYFAPEELVGADIILAENLKPRKMRGIESKGMLLASHYTDADGTERVELVGMPGAAAGTPVTLEGASGGAGRAVSPGQKPGAELSGNQAAGTEACGAAVQKPQAIDAELFFAVPFTVEDFRVCAAGKQLLVNGKPLVMKHVKSGTVQ